jgi:uncharacterized protein (TIGR03000 family)
LYFRTAGFTSSVTTMQIAQLSSGDGSRSAGVAEMYTIAMMMAMTTAPEVPQFNGHFRELFGGSSCHSSSKSDSKSSCNGCSGGLFKGFLGGRGCCGGGCCGGSGSGKNRESDPLPERPTDRGMVAAPRPNGCYASIPYSSCNGSCNGGIVYGGCTGGMYSGMQQPMMVPGNGYAMPIEAGFGQPVADCNCGSTPAVFGDSPGIPRIGSPSPYDYPTIDNPNVPMPMPGFSPQREAPGVTETRGSRKTPMQAEPDASRGTVTVKMPTDAKLFVEGKPMSVKDGERTFVTPPLPTDREAQYSFKIEFTRDGETLTIAKKVNIRAGKATTVDFNDILSSKTKAKSDRVTTALPEVTIDPKTNSKSTARLNDEVPTVKPPVMDHAKFTVKLPEGANLFVNGAKNERTELIRLFTTPTLAPGKSYQYVMKAEITRNGLPEYQEQKIDFQAGDNLTIDFTNLNDSARTAKK